MADKEISTLTAVSLPVATTDLMHFVQGANSRKISVADLSATQANQETGTSNTTFVTPGLQHQHLSAAKCWCLFNGSGTPAILASYGITSITDVGVGQWTLNLSITFSSANFSTTAASTSVLNAFSPASATTISCQTRNGSNTLQDATAISVAAYGDI